MYLNLFIVGNITIGETTIEFTVTVLTLIGLPCWLMYTSIGFVLFPLKQFKSNKHLKGKHTMDILDLEAEER
mgnify:CR=1 FL=1